MMSTRSVPRNRSQKAWIPNQTTTLRDLEIVLEVATRARTRGGEGATDDRLVPRLRARGLIAAYSLSSAQTYARQVRDILRRLGLMTKDDRATLLGAQMLQTSARERRDLWQRALLDVADTKGTRPYHPALALLRLTNYLEECTRLDYVPVLLAPDDSDQAFRAACNELPVRAGDHARFGRTKSAFSNLAKMYPALLLNAGLLERGRTSHHLRLSAAGRIALEEWAGGVVSALPDKQNQEFVTRFVSRRRGSHPTLGVLKTIRRSSHEERLEAYRALRLRTRRHHAIVERLLAAWQHYAPVEDLFDIALFAGGSSAPTHIVEVKTTTARDMRQRIRDAIGQLADYDHLVVRKYWRSARPVRCLVVDTRPGPQYAELLDRENIACFVFTNGRLLGANLVARQHKLLSFAAPQSTTKTSRGTNRRTGPGRARR